MTLKLGRVHPNHLDRGLMAMWTEYYSSLCAPMPRLEVLQVFFPPDQFCSCHRDFTPRLSKPTARSDFRSCAAIAAQEGSDPPPAAVMVRSPPG